MEIYSGLDPRPGETFLKTGKNLEGRIGEKEKEEKRKKRGKSFPTNQKTRTEKKRFNDVMDSNKVKKIKNNCFRGWQFFLYAIATVTASDKKINV